MLSLDTKPKQNMTGITISGDQGNQWKKLCMELPTGNYTVTLKGVSGGSWDLVAVDDIQYSEGECPIDSKIFHNRHITIYILDFSSR